MPIELRDYQKEALNEILKHKRGLVVLATGAGKTVIGIALLQYLYQRYEVVNYYVLVPTTALVAQWKERLKRAGIPVGDDSVLTYPSFVNLVKRVGVARIFSNYTLDMYLSRGEGKSGKVNVIIIDEAHHAHTETKLWDAVLQSSADYVVGLTATPNPLKKYNLPVIYEKSISDLVPYLSKFNLHKVPVKLEEADKEGFEEAVNELGAVMKGIKRASERGDTAELVTLERKKQSLLSEIPYFVAVDPNVIMTTVDIAKRLSGKTIIKTNRIVAALEIQRILIRYGFNRDEILYYADKHQLDELYNGKWKYLITVKALSEGIDIPEINNVILSSYDYSHKLSLIQTVGRALRKSLLKDAAEIYILVPDLKQYEKIYEDLKVSMEGE